MTQWEQHQHLVAARSWLQSGEYIVRVGVTGHLNLSDETVPLVTAAIRDYLSQFAGHALVGVSCLARGADSLFAQVVIELGGVLEVVLPSADYREAEVEPDHAPQFDELLVKAAVVRTMPFDTAGTDAYAAANEVILGSVDQLVAVWDGQPSSRRGGTADAVVGARSRGLDVQVIWPERSRRC